MQKDEAIIKRFGSVDGEQSSLLLLPPYHKTPIKVKVNIDKVMVQDFHH